MEKAERKAVGRLVARSLAPPPAGRPPLGILACLAVHFQLNRSDEKIVCLFDDPNAIKFIDIGLLKWEE